MKFELPLALSLLEAISLLRPVFAQSVSCPGSNGSQVKRGGKIYEVKCNQVAAGMPFKTTSGTFTLEECAEQCAKEPQCVNVVHTANKECQLKDAKSPQLNQYANVATLWLIGDDPAASSGSGSSASGSSAAEFPADADQDCSSIDVAAVPASIDLSKANKAKYGCNADNGNIVVATNGKAYKLTCFKSHQGGQYKSVGVTNGAKECVEHCSKDSKCVASDVTNDGKTCWLIDSSFAKRGVAWTGGHMLVPASAAEKTNAEKAYRAQLEQERSKELQKLQSECEDRNAARAQYRNAQAKNLATYNCPQDEGKCYYSGNKVYQLKCSTAIRSAKTTPKTATSLKECADICSSTSDCYALDFLAPEKCSLKIDVEGLVTWKGDAFFPVANDDVCVPPATSTTGGNCGSPTVDVGCPTPTCPEPVCPEPRCPVPVCPEPQCYPPDLQARNANLKMCEDYGQTAVFRNDGTFYNCMDT